MGTDRNYFVFKKPRRSSGLIRGFRIPKDDAFPSVVHDILEKVFHVSHTLAYFHSGYFYMCARLSFHLCHLGGILRTLNKIALGSKLPKSLNRSS